MKRNLIIVTLLVLTSAAVWFFTHRWQEVRDEARGFSISCPTTALVELYAFGVHCSIGGSLFGDVSVATTTAQSAQEVVDDWNRRAFVGAEKSIVGQSKIAGVVGIITTTNGVGGRGMFLVRDGKLYQVYTDFGADKAAEGRFLSSFRFLDK